MIRATAVSSNLEAAQLPPSISPTTGAARRDTIQWRLILLLALLWLAPLAGLSVHWDTNPEYHFGYFVPLLAAYAGYHRWKTRPAPGRSVPGSVAIAILGTLAVLPAWVFAQPSPDWTLLNWTFTALVGGITLSLVAASGGWSWVKHFAFPVLIVFTAVPWLDYIESPFTQTLMRLVASASVEVLDLVGVGALQHGNLIEVASGTVGVDEACSGIRSLHGSLMASIVLGEFFRFGAARRISLVAVSLSVAFATNVFRASFLAWNAAQSGLGAVDRWHDPAGFTTLGFCVLCIFGTALALDRHNGALYTPATLPPSRPLPRWLAPALTVWLVLGAVATFAWYYDPAPAPIGPLRAYPVSGSSHARIGATALESFRSTEATALKGAASGHSQWLLYFFHWDFGPSFTRVAASMHSPEICLPAGGRQLDTARGEMLIVAAGREFPFQAYSFQDRDGLLYVYHGIWPFSSARAAQHGPLPAQKYLAAWQSVIRRERNVGQQSAELIITGCRTADEADAAARDLFARLLVPRIASAPLAQISPP